MCAFLEGVCDQYNPLAGGQPLLNGSLLIQDNVCWPLQPARPDLSPLPLLIAKALTATGILRQNGWYWYSQLSVKVSSPSRRYRRMSTGSAPSTVRSNCARQCPARPSGTASVKIFS
ncbi:hypothetical protein ALO78_101634 [Pseudomonas amygdali pv. ciccaronei]|nr:hypothetical protein ALO78_101634 [Pseudomonas amygdali pv. ciccaronei]